MQSVIAWGSNDKGQLGLGDKIGRNDLSSRLIIPFKDISSGGFHNIAITENGSVYVWGYGYNDQLGLGNNQDRLEPTFLEGMNAVQVAAGQIHSLLLTGG